MRERHGVADAKRLSAVSGNNEQSVVVTDGCGNVILTTSSTDPAGLTPEQADWLADALRASAERVRRATQPNN